MKRATLVLAALLVLGLFKPALAVGPEPGVSGPYVMFVVYEDSPVTWCLLWLNTDVSRDLGQWFLINPVVGSLQGDWEMLAHAPWGGAWSGTATDLPPEEFRGEGIYLAAAPQVILGQVITPWGAFWVLAIRAGS